MNDKYLEKHPESKQSLALVQKEISVKECLKLRMQAPIYLTIS